jgi:protein-S-isoprenylcysteine O-methyltransferase Ste14
VEARLEPRDNRNFRVVAKSNVYRMILFLAGLAIALGSDWMLVLVVPAALILHFGVVKREERYLEAKFGESYRAYMERVPRYWF